MFSEDQYSLIDFGNGRRLERFGALVLDRPCPSANAVQKKNRKVWLEADARFEVKSNKKGANDSKGQSNALGFRGRWRPLTELGEQYFSIEDDSVLSQDQNAEQISSRPWLLWYGDKFTFELKGSPFGHIGVFPEQAENWDRIYELCKRGQEKLRRPLRILNLFGYTGGSALAAIAAGAHTTHLDAARNVIAQAKRNAALSFDNTDKNAAMASVRWIVDDAVKFVKRELKRESFYDGVILDPPSYGHGARGEVWRLSRDLQPLLDNIVKLLIGEFCFVMLSGHTPRYGAPVLERMLRDSFKEYFASTGEIGFLAKTLTVDSRYGAELYSGDLALAYPMV